MSELAQIQKKVDGILSQINSDIKRKKNTMLVSVVGGIILLIIVFIYFSWIKGLIQEVLEPKGLMLMGRDKIERMLPEVSKNLEESLKKEAPNIAKYSSQQILLAIPDGRKYLENQFIMKTEEAIDSLVTEFDKMVSDALMENRSTITAFMRDASDPVKKEQLTQDIYQSLKLQFSQDDIKPDIDSYTKALQNLNKKIKYLYEEEDLTEEEALVRDIIFALRELASRGAKQKI